MALLLIFAAWILTLSVVVALCRAARQGDLQPRREKTARVAPEPPTVVVSRTTTTSRSAPRTSNPLAHAGRATG
jgi:hypothetical protein